MDADVARELGASAAKIEAIEGDVVEVKAAVSSLHSRLSGLRAEWQEARERDLRDREQVRREKDVAKIDEARERKKDRVLYVSVTIAAIGASGWIVTLLTGPS